MLTEVSTTRFVVKVNGVAISTRLQTKTLAEAFLLTLAPQQRAIAEIVPVADNGKELLLG